GIRDFHVTGVQTCALPISCLWHPILLSPDHGTPDVPVLEHAAFRQRVDAVAAASARASLLPRNGGAWVPQIVGDPLKHPLIVEEIGRASCKEKESNAVGAR